MLDFASGQTAVAISLLGGLLGLAAAALVALTRGRRLRPATSEAPVGQPSRATAPEVPTVYVSQAASVYTETQERLRSRYLESKLASGDSHSSTSQKDLVQELERIGRVATLQPGQRALEVGCGLGVWTMHLARQGFKAYGLDLDPDFVEEGRKQAARQGVDAHFVAAPAEKLPFDDGYFDVVISSFVLEHVADWRVMLREMLRVLRPGGVAYLSTNCVFYPFTNEVRLPLFPYYPGWLKRRLLKLAIERYPSWVNYTPTPACNWFTPGGLKRAFSDVGFGEVYDVFDLLHPGELSGKRRVARFILPIVKRVKFLRGFIHIVIPGLRVYAVKG